MAPSTVPPDWRKLPRGCALSLAFSPHFPAVYLGGKTLGDPIGQGARPRRRRAWAATAAAISSASWKGRSASRAIRWARRWVRFDGVVARGVGIASVDPAGQGGAAGCLFAVDSSSFRIKSLFAADSSSFRRIKSLESAPRRSLGCRSSPPPEDGISFGKEPRR